MEESNAQYIRQLPKLKLSIRTIANYIAVFVVFSNALSLYTTGAILEVRIAYFLMLFLLLLTLPFIRDVKFNRSFLVVLSVLSVCSVYNIYIGNNAFVQFLKQLFGISTSAVFFYLLISFNNYDTKRLFKVYLRIAYVVALIGIFQEISYLLRFKPGYDFSFILPNWKVEMNTQGTLLRINSILPEPAHFCGALMVAFFVSLTSFTKYDTKLLNRWKSGIIVVAMILSFSSVGYIGALLSIMILSFDYGKMRYFVISLAAVAALSLAMYVYVPEVATRAGSVMSVVTGEANAEDADLSSFALMSNALVVYKSLQNNFIIGTGLGSHELNYEKYISSVIDLTNRPSLNKEDAGSLFLRLLSETGVFGLLLFFVFIIKFYLKRRDDPSKFYWIMNNAILCMFLIKLLRYGHYFADGFFFFLWLYYFSKCQSVEVETASEESPAFR